MGWGDELIAAGQAREIHERTGRKVLIYDRNGAIRWHAMWQGNPHIIRRDERVSKAESLSNGPSIRPYIVAKSAERWTWREWQCPLGEIFFTEAELEFGRAGTRVLGEGIVIEPSLKAKASPNKDWGRERWAALAGLMLAKGLRPVQIGPLGTQIVPGAKLIETPDFRRACALLAHARAAVLPEGGLHHAAAALGVKSVVIFGGYISPRQTGYARQTNLFTGGSACGLRVPCKHCSAALAAITPQIVMMELEKLLGA